MSFGGLKNKEAEFRNCGLKYELKNMIVLLKNYIFQIKCTTKSATIKLKEEFKS